MVLSDSSYYGEVLEMDSLALHSMLNVINISQQSHWLKQLQERFSEGSQIKIGLLPVTTNKLRMPSYSQ